GSPNVASTGPEADAADFVRVCFAGDDVGAGPLGGAAAGKTGYGKVKAAPEKMHRAALTNEARPKLVEDAVHGDKDLPEAADVLGIVRGVNAVLIEGYRVGNFG